jgi:hypothetical protein
MSEIDKPANPTMNIARKSEWAVIENRRSRLLYLSPEMLREMAERGELTKTPSGSAPQSQTGVWRMSDEPGDPGTEPGTTVTHPVN